MERHLLSDQTGFLESAQNLRRRRRVVELFDLGDPIALVVERQPPDVVVFVRSDGRRALKSRPAHRARRRTIWHGHVVVDGHLARGQYGETYMQAHKY